MLPEQKAKELIENFWYKISGVPETVGVDLNGEDSYVKIAKECAIIAVQELIISTWSWDWYKRQKYIDVQDELKTDFWKEVKEHIEQL